MLHAAQPGGFKGIKFGGSLAFAELAKAVAHSEAEKFVISHGTVLTIL